MLLEVITIVSNCGRLSSMFSAIRLKETKGKESHLVILGKADNRVLFYTFQVALLCIFRIWSQIIINKFKLMMVLHGDAHN